MSPTDDNEVAQATSDLDEVAPPIGTGMRPVPAGAGAEFDAETAERLRDRLDEFDAVRARGEVESRSVHLGGLPPR